MVFEYWLISSAEMKMVSRFYQFFVQRDTNSDISLLMAKVTDDLLMVGKRSDLESFMELLGKLFPIIKSIIDDPILFNWRLIRQDINGDVCISMDDYAEFFPYLEMTHESRKHDKEKVTVQCYTVFKYFSVEIMWLGGGVSSQSSFFSSYLQQRTSNLRVRHSTQANKLLRQLKALPATLRYTKVPHAETVDVYSFADD